MFNKRIILLIILYIHLFLALFDFRFFYPVFTFIIVYFLLHKIGAFFNSPWEPAKKEDIMKMLKLAKLKSNEILYDLGSGDGRIAITAAKEFQANTIGIEINPVLVLWSRFLIWINSLSKKAKIVQGNLFKENLKNADVVVTYLLTKTQKKLEKKFKKELKKGTRIVCLRFPYPDWSPVKVLKGSYDVYLYKIR